MITIRPFGLGGLFITQANSINPIELAKLQDATPDFSFDVKELYGQYGIPIEAVRGKGKASIKASWAEVRADAYNLILNGSSATGTRMISRDNNATIPSASGPYTVAAAIPSGGTWVGNLQVINLTQTDSSGLPTPMTCVASSPSTMQYTVNASGTYTFASADAGNNVQYTFEFSKTTGHTITLANPLMGVSPRFAVRLYNVYGDAGKQYGLYFPACTATKLGGGMKLDDFLVPDVEISIFADGSNNVAYWYISD